MSEFLCWCLDDWVSPDEALADPECATLCIGYYDAKQAAEEFRDGDGDDGERSDDVPVLVQQVEEGVTPYRYVGRPKVFDVSREVVHRYSATEREGGTDD